MTSDAHARSLLSSTVNQNIQQALRAHRNYTETLAEQTVRDGEARGFIDIDGGNESVAEIRFPLRFLEKPIFTSGLELPDNTWLSWGSFPQWSATVATWATEPLANAVTYVGCTLGIVILGPPKATLHYRFAARSYTNPTGAAQSVAAVL